MRTRKVTTANALQGVNTFFYFYDPDYHLIAETGGATLAQAHTPIMTYIWNDSILTGIIVHQPSRTAYTVDVDHLGSPYQVRTLAGKVVWRWDSDAFGTQPPNEDVDGDGNKLTLNLRFPGQYYDQESGLYYNVKRYYSAKLARYLSPDPIGLAGGSNRFAYVEGRPTSLFDFNGLEPKDSRYAVQCGRCTLIYDNDRFKGSHTHWVCPGQPQGCIKRNGDPCDGSPPPPPEVEKCLRDRGRISDTPEPNSCSPVKIQPPWWLPLVFPAAGAALSQ